MAQKNYGEIFHSMNIQAEKSYGNGFNIKIFTGETNIKKLNGKNLMAKDKALKNVTILII